jgi:hypothetical protein
MGRTTIVILALACVACKTAAAPKVEALPRDNREGRVGFEVVSDLKPNVPVLGAAEEYRAAYPFPENPLPVYPASLLQHNLPRQEVVVRVIIDGDGNVARFEASPVTSNVEPLYKDDFVHAVEETVKTWRFDPANIRTFGPGPDTDGDGQSDFVEMKDSRNLTSYHDLRFFFEIKDGRGVVTSG